MAQELGTIFTCCVIAASCVDLVGTTSLALLKKERLIFPSIREKNLTVTLTYGKRM